MPECKECGLWFIDGETHTCAVKRGPLELYFRVLNNYAAFGGRARRKEYWLFTLFSLLIAQLLLILDLFLGFTFGGGLLSGLFMLAILSPTVAVTVRRLHDTNHSGWRLLILLIPIAGFIVVLMDLIENGQPDENRYGPSPKQTAVYPIRRPNARAKDG